MSNSEIQRNWVNTAPKNLKISIFLVFHLYLNIYIKYFPNLMLAIDRTSQNKKISLDIPPHLKELKEKNTKVPSC